MLQFDINDKYVKQNFSMPSPFIRYLMTNINSNGLKKLHKSCKYFYVRFKIHILDYLNIHFDPKFHTVESYELCLGQNQLDQLPNNLWLTKDFLLDSNLNPKHISKFLGKIFRCDIKDLYLFDIIKLTVNELKILTQSQTVEYVHTNMRFYSSHDNNAIAPIEDVLPCFLCAERMQFEIFSVTRQTMKKLLLLKFGQSLDYLYLHVIDEINDTKYMDPKSMDEFLKKNFGETGVLSFRYINETEKIGFKWKKTYLQPYPCSATTFQAVLAPQQQPSVIGQQQPMYPPTFQYVGGPPLLQGHPVPKYGQYYQYYGHPGYQQYHGPHPGQPRLVPPYHQHPTVGRQQQQPMYPPTFQYVGGPPPLQGHPVPQYGQHQFQQYPGHPGYQQYPAHQGYQQYPGPHPGQPPFVAYHPSHPFIVGPQHHPTHPPTFQYLGGPPPLQRRPIPQYGQNQYQRYSGHPGYQQYPGPYPGQLRLVPPHQQQHTYPGDPPPQQYPPQNGPQQF